MDALTLKSSFALTVVCAVVGVYVYAHRTGCRFRIVPVLLATAALVTALEFLPPDYSASWHWPAALIVAALAGAGIARLVTGAHPDGNGVRGTVRRLVSSFVDDRRLTFVACAVLVAILATVPFGRLAKAENPPGFWASYYASWTANLVFFAILGVAGIVVSVQRPEKDEFSRRVRILFGGRQDAAVDYITETIRKIGYYADEVSRTYRIRDFDRERNAALIRVEHRTVTRNFYDDLAAVDNAMISMKPDPFVPSLPVVGHLVSFSVDGVNRLSHPLPLHESTEFTHREAIEIPSGGRSEVLVVSEAWYSLSEAHDYEPNRFAKSVRINLIHEGNTPGEVVPVTVELPALASAKLGYLKELRVQDMVNRVPGKVAFTFRLSLPEKEP